MKIHHQNIHTMAVYTVLTLTWGDGSIVATCALHVAFPSGESELVLLQNNASDIDDPLLELPSHEYLVEA